MGVVFYLNKCESLLPENALCQQVWLTLEKKMLKFYRRTDVQTDRRTTDDTRSEKLTSAFISGELKTKYSLIRDILDCRIGIIDLKS